MSLGIYVYSNMEKTQPTHALVVVVAMQLCRDESEWQTDGGVSVRSIIDGSMKVEI